MKKFIFLLFMFVSLIAEANYWTPNPYQYQNNMTVVGVISFNGVEQQSDMLEIGAFCEGECRGSVITQYEEVFDRSYAFLMIYGEYNDSITFRCYDHNRNIELEMIPESHIMFQSNAMMGGVADPFVFSFQSYKHNVNIELSPEATATIIGGGEYNQYDTCYVEITPNQGFQFDALTENGDTLTTQPNYSFIVMSDRNLVAHLSEIPNPNYYQVSAEINPDAAGTISGLGAYQEGETCNLEIVANEGYDFVALKENGEVVSEENTYSFIVESDRHFLAEFALKEYVVTLSDNGLTIYPNPASDFINIRGLEKKVDATIYELTGTVILKKTLSSEDNIIDVSNIPNGTYIITIDNKNQKIIIN
ncbi:MAG: T9SS type A sorting domain-containing protein [Bacteroidales bacterium]|nr:T9SS type A sorting domain-containing protein [Bacteroidales bacterium]